MTSIIKAEVEHAQLLSGLAKITLIESHGHSAPPADINNYIEENYSIDVFREELTDPKNIYYILYHDNRVAGYSKIIFNAPYTNSSEQNLAKLERIYLLKEFYDLKLGLQLLQFNISLSKQNDQIGMWLYTWKENHRAVSFYKRAGFEIIGSYNFKISETHSNPNYKMLLKFPVTANPLNEE